MPSFFGNGVPEYPAVAAFETFFERFLALFS
jgi:hypothetical protein